jgi:hypothetical protein
VLVALLCHLALGSPGSAAESEAGRAALRVHLRDGSVAVLTETHDLYLEASPRRGEGLLSFSRRFCSNEDAAALVAAENGGSKKLLAGIRYRIPFAVLESGYQVQVLGPPCAPRYLPARPTTSSTAPIRRVSSRSTA